MRLRQVPANCRRQVPVNHRTPRYRTARGGGSESDALFHPPTWIQGTWIEPADDGNGIAFRFTSGNVYGWHEKDKAEENFNSEYSRWDEVWDVALDDGKVNNVDTILNKV